MLNRFVSPKFHREVNSRWCTYMEGTTTENKLCSRNSKTGRGGTKEPTRSILYQEIE